jgi:hypothetical protein
LVLELECSLVLRGSLFRNLSPDVAAIGGSDGSFDCG